MADSLFALLAASSTSKRDYGDDDNNEGLSDAEVQHDEHDDGIAASLEQQDEQLEMDADAAYNSYDNTEQAENITSVESSVGTDPESSSSADQVEQQTGQSEEAEPGDTAADGKKKYALLLGVVYANEYTPKRGQEYRDRVRCEAMECIGYEVYTLDDKHEETRESVPGRHCKANFSDARRMAMCIRQVWGYALSFDVIILDYFFSPVRFLSAIATPFPRTEF